MSTSCGCHNTASQFLTLHIFAATTWVEIQFSIEGFWCSKGRHAIGRLWLQMPHCINHVMENSVIYIKYTNWTAGLMTINESFHSQSLWLALYSRLCFQHLCHNFLFLDEEGPYYPTIYSTHSIYNRTRHNNTYLNTILYYLVEVDQYLILVFPMRCYASVVLSMALYLSKVVFCWQIWLVLAWMLFLTLSLINWTVVGRSTESTVPAKVNG